MSGPEALFRLVAQIPAGRCSGYGTIGRALPHPVSGLIVGRWMRGCPSHLPWWRVVGTNGDLPIAKRDPGLAHEQRTRLAAEGVTFNGDRIDMAQYGWQPEWEDHTVD